MLPPVLTELLSSIYFSEEDKEDLIMLPRLDVTTGFWERTGRLRCDILKQGLKARTLDCLIAQICIDHKVPLISNDSDFRHFIKYGLVFISKPS
jgi:predicted nucleic acid-binding protein